MTRNVNERHEVPADEIHHRIEAAKASMAATFVAAKKSALRAGLSEEEAAEVADLWIDVKARYEVFDGPLDTES